jgi:transglutaminase superfamily protein
MRIPFDVAGVFYPGSSDEDDALALQALMEALVTIDRVYLRRFPQSPRLEQSGVRYARTNEWQSVPDLLHRGYGDCKSLTAMHVAELRNAGMKAKPVFRLAINPQTGRKEFHILTQAGAAFIDMSRRLGMEQFHAQNGLWLFPQ